MDFLEIIDLKDKKVSSMSTGQLRKCIVARALIHDPKAFVLDEPTVGLDIKAQINFIKLLQKISLKSTIILVTHHLEEIFPEIKNVALIYNNTIFKIGKKEDILNSENLSTVFDIKIEVKQKNERYYFEKIPKIVYGFRHKRYLLHAFLFEHFKIPLVHLAVPIRHIRILKKAKTPLFNGYCVV